MRLAGVVRIVGNAEGDGAPAPADRQPSFDRGWSNLEYNKHDYIFRLGPFTREPPPF